VPHEISSACIDQIPTGLIVKRLIAPGYITEPAQRGLHRDSEATEYLGGAIINRKFLAVNPKLPVIGSNTIVARKLINKDGRLIRLDYVFRKTAPGGALKHNQSYQTPRLLFLFLISTALQLLKRMYCVWRCTRLRLVSHTHKLESSTTERYPFITFRLG